MNMYFLDMGTEKYGDCIVVEHSGRKILIDGAHPGDSTSILMQLKKILRSNSPYEFDLLIMTHCHSDHIGCLPALVQSGDLRATKSLLANPVYRWGDEDGSTQDHFNESTILREALLEEDHSDMKDDELERFLFDAPRLLPGYKAMIATLKDQGHVTLYDGFDETDYSSLEQEFADFGLKILGPSAEHLRMTQNSLGVGAIEDAIDRLSNSIDSAISLTDAYRRLATSLLSDTSEEGTGDKTNKGAINNQSIVVKFKTEGPEGWSAMLAGDMQFAKAEVTGMNDIMADLLTRVNNAGPYDIIKLTHHTSYNGTDESILDNWLNGTKLFVHTGGKRDGSHPEESVLEMLKSRKHKLKFIRNDRHGIMTIGKDEQNKFTFWLSKGEPNNFTPNTASDITIVEQPNISPNPARISPMAEVQTPAASQQQIKQVAVKDAQEVVELTARIPHHATRVTITVDIEDKKKSPSETP